MILFFFDREAFDASSSLIHYFLQPWFGTFGCGAVKTPTAPFFGFPF